MQQSRQIKIFKFNVSGIIGQRLEGTQLPLKQKTFISARVYAAFEL